MKRIPRPEWYQGRQSSFFSLTTAVDGGGLESRHPMKAVVQTMVGTAIVAVLGLTALPALYQTQPPPPGAGGGGYNPAPGPIAGAGLPVLAVGFGVYWLVRRFRR